MSQVTQEGFRVVSLSLHIERTRLAWASDQDAFQVRCFRHIQLGGDAGTNRLAGENMSLGCRERWLGRGRCGQLCLDYCPSDTDEQKKMYRWVRDEVKTFCVATLTLAAFKGISRYQTSLIFRFCHINVMDSSFKCYTLTTHTYQKAHLDEVPTKASRMSTTSVS